MRYLMIVLSILMPTIGYCTDIETLMKQKSIRITCEGQENSVHYVRPLYITITNISPQAISVVIPTGYVFAPADSSYQSIVITMQLIAALKSGQTETFDLYGMCIEPHDRAPDKGAYYTPSYLGDAKLVKLATFIEKMKYFTSTGQAAVWALVDDRDLDCIYGFDSTETNSLIAFMHDLTGKPIPPPPAADDYERNLFSNSIKVRVGGDLEFDLPRQYMVTWSLFDDNGILVRELYNGPLGPGEDTLSFVYDATVYTAPIYHLKLVVDGEVLVEQQIGKREEE